MSSNGRFEAQDDNPNAWVGVASGGSHRDTGTPGASEFIIQGKDPADHIHIGFDESGNQIFGPPV